MEYKYLENQRVLIFRITEEIDGGTNFNQSNYDDMGIFTYQQTGNSIVVDVLIALLKQMDITKYGKKDGK